MYFLVQLAFKGSKIGLIGSELAFFGFGMALIGFEFLKIPR
jgi:hypothetical protein